MLTQPFLDKDLPMTLQNVTLLLYYIGYLIINILPGPLKNSSRYNEQLVLDTFSWYRKVSVNTARNKRLLKMILHFSSPSTIHLSKVWFLSPIPYYKGGGHITSEKGDLIKTTVLCANICWLKCRKYKSKIKLISLDLCNKYKFGKMIYTRKWMINYSLP